MSLLDNGRFVCVPREMCLLCCGTGGGSDGASNMSVNDDGCMSVLRCSVGMEYFCFGLLFSIVAIVSRIRELGCYRSLWILGAFHLSGFV